MLKVISILIFCSFPLFLLMYYRSLKKTKSKVSHPLPIIDEEQEKIIKIYKNNPTQHPNTQDLLVDISTIIKRDNYYDFLLTFNSHLGKHIRIDIKEIKLFTTQFKNGLSGNFSFQDLTLGTNDYILKNTIIAGGNLIRNVHFKTNEIIDFNGNDTIIIELKINNEPYTIKTCINESTVKEIKIIGKKEISLTSPKIN